MRGTGVLPGVAGMTRTVSPLAIELVCPPSQYVRRTLSSLFCQACALLNPSKI